MIILRWFCFIKKIILETPNQSSRVCLEWIGPQPCRVLVLTIALSSTMDEFTWRHKYPVGLLVPMHITQLLHRLNKPNVNLDQRYLMENWRDIQNECYSSVIVEFLRHAFVQFGACLCPFRVSHIVREVCFSRVAP